jgi:hypothetical protein
MKPSKSTSVLLVALILTNAAWAYASLNSGVGQTHMSDQLRHREDLADLLASFVLELPRDGGSQAAFQFLRSRYPNAVVKLDRGACPRRSMLLS